MTKHTMKPASKAKPRAISAVAVSAPMDPEMKYRAQDALQALKRAHEIKNDPKLMQHVREHAKTERAAITKVIGRGTKKAS